MIKFVLGAAAVVGVYWLWKQAHPCGCSSASSAAASMGAGNAAPFATAYPGGMVPSATPATAVFSNGQFVDTVSPPNDQPLSQLPPPSPIAGGGVPGRLSALGGRLGALLVPGVSSGTGTQGAAVAFRP